MGEPLNQIREPMYRTGGPTHWTVTRDVTPFSGQFRRQCTHSRYSVLHGRRNVQNIGGAGCRILRAQVLGVILPQGTMKLSCGFWTENDRNGPWPMSYLPLCFCHQNPAKLSLLSTPTAHKPCFDLTNYGYCLPPMGQTRIWTRISENRNVSYP